MSLSNRDLMEAEVQCFLAGPIIDEETGYNGASTDRVDFESATERAVVLAGEDGKTQLLERLWSATEPLVDQENHATIERVAARLGVDREWSGEEFRQILAEIDGAV